MKDYFCYYELHVQDKTFYLNVLIPAKNANDAFKKMDNAVGEKAFEHMFHLQAKACLGIYDPIKHRKFMTEIGGGINFD